MKYLLLLISFNVFAVEDYKFYMDVSTSKFQYEWYGVGASTYTMNLNTIGYGVDHKSGFGSRISIGSSNQVTTNKESKYYENYYIALESYGEIELYYKYNLYKSLSVYGGIGWYFPDVPVYYADGSLAKADKDYDHGYFTGFEYKINDFSILLFVKQTSVIGEGKGKSNTVTLGSTMRQLGLSLRLVF